MISDRFWRELAAIKGLPPVHFIEVDGCAVPEPNIMAWTRWQDIAERRVRVNQRRGVEVSTVFLAIRWGTSEPPLLYETMVFGGDRDGEVRHYATRREAIAGHKAMLVRLGIWPGYPWQRRLNRLRWLQRRRRET